VLCAPCIERKGKALAALVPIERLEQMRRFARVEAFRFLQQQRGSGLTERQAEEVAIEAQKAARRRVQRTRRPAR
jgi:hypothetical protein